jgi:hypothetical protein
MSTNRNDRISENFNPEPESRKAIELNPKVGVEMVEGKKYLLVVDVSHVSPEDLDKFSHAAPLYEAAFKARGIDVTFLATPWVTKIYELLPAAEESCQQSPNV